MFKIIIEIVIFNKLLHTLWAGSLVSIVARYFLGMGYEHINLLGERPLPVKGLHSLIIYDNSAC